MAYNYYLGSTEMFLSGHISFDFIIWMYDTENKMLSSECDKTSNIVYPKNLSFQAWQFLR